MSRQVKQRHPIDTNVNKAVHTVTDTDSYTNIVLITHIYTQTDTDIYLYSVKNTYLDGERLDYPGRYSSRRG